MSSSCDFRNESLPRGRGTEISMIMIAVMLEPLSYCIRATTMKVATNSLDILEEDLNERNADGQRLGVL